MAGQSKNITIYVFLFALFITLAMVLGARTYNIYISSKTQTESTLKSTMQCAFSFWITTIEYSGGSLSFDLKTSDEKMLRKIVIVGNDAPKEIELGPYIGMRQRVNAGSIGMGDKFIVYPYGCEAQNKKECALSTGLCENA